MEKYDESEGFWRTIGGRRIFIRDGESLSSAMKKSGKFKSARKKEYLTEHEREEYKTASNERKQELNNEDEKRRIENEMPVDKEKSEKYGFNEKHAEVKSQQSDIEKASGLKVKKAFETDLYGNGKEDRFEIDKDKWISHTKEAGGKQTDQWSVNELKNGSVESRDFGSYKEMLEHLSNNSKGSENKGSGVQSQKSDIEKASGLKVKKAFESNLYGNGKEDRFELDDGRIVSHTKNAMGKDTDTWSIGKFKNGSMDETTFKNYDEMIERLKNDRSVRQGIDETRRKINDHISKVDSYTNEMNELRGKEDEASKAAYKKTQQKLLRETDYYKHGPEVRQTNAAYKKAFAEYMKKHPNSKLTLNKFIDMSEGK